MVHSRRFLPQNGDKRFKTSFLSTNSLTIPLSLPCLGVSVCRDARLQILGIGRDRLARCKKHFRGTDQRTLGSLSSNICHICFIGVSFLGIALISLAPGQRVHSCKASASVTTFLQKTYFAIAETLPHEHLDTIFFAS